jgi:glutamine---fructose-6-phosphate transaminase (isomerizing)
LIRAAHATHRLLETRETWLDRVADVLDGPDGVFVMAPAERECSAAQSALMIREGARRPSVAAETGEWSHTHVYLTRTLDYRALIFPGSPWDSQALEWLHRRGSRYVSVGPIQGGTPDVLAPFPGADDPLAALFTDPLLGELLAHRWWVDA